jgi:pimeloyl-ACP methyl ester carboxylesterase
MSILAGLKFIVSTSFLKNDKQGDERVLNLPNGNTPVLLYCPSKREKGLIISLTGFSMSGYQDKRIAVVNNTFAKLGYRVITPKIETIDSLMIHPSGIDEVKEVIQSIAEDPILNPNQFRPAVFAPSFTAGIAALAVAEMPENSVSALCLLGSFCDFETTIEFALTNGKNEDDYGMHILMKNFLKYEIGNNPNLEGLIHAALEDNGLKRAEPLLPKLLAETNSETVELYRKLRFDSEYRKEMIMRAWTKIPDFDRWKDRLDLSKHAHKITCPVTLIHGKDDVVIPSSESILMHSLMKNHNPKIHLELSNLIDHGDMKIGLSILRDIATLARAFGYFMVNI